MVNIHVKIDNERLSLIERSSIMNYQEMANKRWNSDTIKQMVVNAEAELSRPQEEIPITSDITTNYLSGLIQTDNTEYADLHLNMFGQNGERGTERELRADQMVDYAEYLQEDWEDRKESFLSPSWFDTSDFVKRATQYMDKVQGTKSVHNTAALEQAQSYRVENSRRFREKIAEEKDKDLEFRVNLSKEIQADIREDIDIRNSWSAEERAEEVPFYDTRTKEGAWFEYINNRLNNNPDAEFLLKVAEFEENGFLRLKAGQILREEMVGCYRRTCMKVARLKKYFHKKYKPTDGVYWAKCFQQAYWTDDSNFYFEIPEDIRVTDYFRRQILQNSLKGLLMAEAEAESTRRQLKKKREEKALLERLENPDRIVGILQGEKFWFTYPETDELIEGSHSDIKYLYNDGEVLDEPIKETLTFGKVPNYKDLTDNGWAHKQAMTILWHGWTRSNSNDDRRKPSTMKPKTQRQPIVTYK
jgi:hypothetical protein